MAEAVQLGWTWVVSCWMAPPGWFEGCARYTGGKIEATIQGKKVWLQVGLNVTIPGSKVNRASHSVDTLESQCWNARSGTN